jgi:hypothetical protein
MNGTVIGGRPGICTTVDPICGGRPGSGGGGGGPPGPGGGDGAAGLGGGAGATPLLTIRVTTMPGTTCPFGMVPSTVPADAALFRMLTWSAI